MPALFPARNQFIFRPNAPAGSTRFEAGTPVYSDWSDLYADLQAESGRKVVVFDFSLAVAAITLPAGTYDMSDTTWEGAYEPLATTQVLDFAVGVSVTNLVRISNLRMTSSNAAGPITLLGQDVFTCNDCVFEDGGFSTLALPAAVGDILIRLDRTTTAANTLTADAAYGDECTVQITNLSTVVGGGFTGGASGALYPQTDSSSSWLNTGWLGLEDAVEGLSRAERVFFTGSTTGLPNGDVRTAIDEVSSTTGGPPTVVWQQGGTTKGNVYVSFADAYAALQATIGYKILVIDSTFEPSAPSIPAGTYDMTDIMWQGRGNATGATTESQGSVGFLPGVTINNLRLVERCNLRSPTSGAAPIKLGGTGTTNLTLRNCQISSLSSPGVFDASGGGTKEVRGFNVQHGAGGVIYQIDATTTLNIELYSGPSTLSSCVAGPVGGTCNVGYSSDLRFPPSAVQAAFSGTYTTTLRGQFLGAAETAYAPAVTGDWLAGDPTNIADALDRIAAALGPIA